MRWGLALLPIALIVCVIFWLRGARRPLVQPT
jgi:hypothetical protein